MATLGLIGSGDIGGSIARLALKAGLDVVLSNSRGPETLSALVKELGPGARAGTPAEAAAAGDWVVVAVPLKNYQQISADLLSGKIVLDANNYYPARDGQIPALAEQQSATSELIQQHLPEAKVVKAFNSIYFTNLVNLARPSGALDRSALPIAGNDTGAKASVAALLDRLGYDAVDAGSLAESWRFENNRPAYVLPYVKNLATAMLPGADDPGIPLDATTLRVLLALARHG